MEVLGCPEGSLTQAAWLSHLLRLSLRRSGQGRRTLTRPVRPLTTEAEGRLCPPWV